MDGFSRFEDGRPDAFQGDTSCPISSCTVTGSEMFVFDHFLHDHRVTNKKDRLLEFLENREYIEWSPHDPPEDSFTLTLKHRESGIEAHPVFTIEMYQSYFGSLNEAEELISTNARIHRDYSPDNPYPERRKFLLKKENVQSRTHKVYGTNWGEVSWEIYQRDDHQCRVCDDSPNSLSELDVHHITPARKFDDQSEMNDPSNLITLCASCHGKHEGDFQGCDPDEFVRRAQAAQPAPQ